MQDLTLTNLRIFGIVLLALAAAIVAIDKGIEVVQKWRGVKVKQQEKDNLNNRLTGIENRLKDCEDRLEKGDAKFTSTDNDNTHMLVALNAMLMHMISGNDHDKLKAVKSELDEYMASRR